MANDQILNYLLLDMTRLEQLLQTAAISLWQANTDYPSNKPVRYASKLYVSKLQHNSGALFTPENYDTLSASSITSNNVVWDDTVTQFGSTTLQEALEGLKQLVSDGKLAIATAITDKGGSALGSYSHAQLAAEVDSLALDGGNPFNTNTKIAISNGQVYDLNLGTPRPISDVCFSVLGLTPGASSNIYTSNFDNGDASNFNFDPEFIEFVGGVCRPITEYDHTYTSQGNLNDGEVFLSEVIDLSKYQQIAKAEKVGDFTAVKLSGTPQPQLVYADGNIDLTGADAINSTTLVGNVHASSVLQIAVSFDEGVSWESFKSSTWSSVDIDNDTQFNSLGMTVAEFNALTQEQWELERDGSANVRFAYRLDPFSYTAPCEMDSVTLEVILNGTFNLADTSNYSTSYNATTGVLTLTFITGGIFTFNWVG